VIKVLTIASPTAPPFQKVYRNYHVIDVIILSMGDVHCSDFRSKSKVHKLGFLWGSITTNDGIILLTIEGK
jgi:hypothetical protein